MIRHGDGGPAGRGRDPLHRAPERGRAIFLLGFLIDQIGRLLEVEPRKRLSPVLLGTHKNTGLAAGLALTLLGERTALPATVSTVFMIVYVVWLSIKQRRFSFKKETQS